MEKQELPTEDEVLRAIFDNVSIRGMELETYEHCFRNERSGLYDILVKLFTGQEKKQKKLKNSLINF